MDRKDRSTKITDGQIDKWTKEQMYQKRNRRQKIGQKIKMKDKKWTIYDVNGLKKREQRR